MATFTNQATLSYTGGTVSSNITTGEILEVLSVTKTAVADTYAVGDEITYAIQLLNAGTAPFTGLTLTDDLGAYTFGTDTLQPADYVEGSVRYFLNGVLQPAPAVTSGPPLSITGLTVPAGGVATVLYTVRTNGFASPAVDGTIVNTATVSGGGITPITATETVTASGTPLLELSKSVSPSVVAENGQITYTFTIENRGNTEAAATDSITVTDTFNPILSDITVAFNGTAFTGNYTYDETTGLFTTTPGAITVPAATYTQDPTTGVWQITPGVATLTVTGTV
ncbi:MAG: DUF11 domain-containing protein [Clostridia bacterium]|nr:DUF11 domain-containing protein [Clostridia bacterium]